MKKVLFSCLFLFFILCGCGNKEGDLISYMKAKELIINENAILLDVRTEDEYNENHINGAINLDVSKIDDSSASEIIDSLDKTVIVYCKSGVRSKQAKDKLEELGYSNVYDLGSISNWEE